MEIEMSVEEMVAKPLTHEDLAAFKQRLVVLGKFENYLFLFGVAVLLALVSIFYGTLLAFGVAAWFVIFFTYVLGFSAFFYFVLVSLPRLVLMRYPTRLVIGGRDRLQGTAGMEFEMVAIDPDRLPEGSQAEQLYQNIVEQGRALVAFEKQIIEELLEQPG